MTLTHIRFPHSISENPFSEFSERTMSDYFICPNCGAEVPATARACPECGSDEETGWSEAADYAHLLPEDLDNDDLPPYPLSGTSPQSRKKWSAWYRYVAILLLAGFGSAAFGGVFRINPLLVAVVLFIVLMAGEYLIKLLHR